MSQNRVKQKIINKKTMPYLMLTPACLFIFCFMLYPIGNTLIMSVQHNVMIDPSGIRFIGLENFTNLIFHDKVFQAALKNSFKWVVGNVFLQSTLGMALALILNQNMRFRGLIRAVTFSPWAVSGIIVSLMWSFMYSESVGSALINTFLTASVLREQRSSTLPSYPCWAAMLWPDISLRGKVS